MISLGKKVQISNGYAFKSSKYVEKGIRVIRITNVQKGEIKDDSPQFYPETTIDTLKNYLIEEGDILMSLTGNVGRVGLFPKELSPAYLNQRVARIRVISDDLDLKYLFYILNSTEFERDAIFNSTGIAQMNLSTKWVADYKIPLPPLETQKKIAAILDEADRYRQKTKELIAKYDELTQNLFLELFGDPVTNPKGWEKDLLKSVCSKITDGTHDTPQRLTQGVKFITGKHIRPFQIDFDNSDYVSEEVHTEIYRRCNPEFGDILYTNIGVNYATAAMNLVHFEFSMKNVALLKYKREVLNGRYLECLLNNSNFKNRLKNNFGIGGAQQFLSLTNIKSIEILRPPIEIQNQFAERVQAIESQKSQAQAALVKAEELFNSLLQRAFKGELV